MRPAPLAPAVAADREQAPASRPRYLVPVLTVRQEVVLRLLALAWFVASVWFALWWLAPARGDWPAGRVLATIGLGWIFLLGGYFLFFVTRMTTPNPALPVPDLRVAMVVTKAPSEPWNVVERTLDAMLAQQFPYPYDVWLADERPSGHTLRWCRGHRVSVSSRQGVAEYHQPTWPRRTKCKEGNLAYFYDTVGYSRYDVVVQLDADHVPAPGYLAAMVRPFADPAVGYVAAPSICDANETASWTVRGRLYREASLHGPTQAGSNGGWAPLCIGSHYAVRTAALREVGGLGPELAEDYSTTLWLQSGGWDGVFALDAEAHGDGPETLGDMLTQELQWARSLGTILTKWAPGRFRTLPWKARARMAFALCFYPIQGLFCVTAAMLPAAGVLSGVTWGHTSFADFYLRLWPSSILLLLVLTWLRRCHVLRPTQARLWSYEIMLFQLIRWPWTTWGFFQGMWAGRRKEATTFRVTPKGFNGVRPLPLSMLAPPLVLASVPIGVILANRDPRPVLGLYLVLLLQVLIYLCAVAVVVVLHIEGNARQVRERLAARPGRNPRGRQRTPLLTWAAGGSAASAILLVLAAGVVLLSWRALSLVG